MEQAVVIFTDRVVRSGWCFAQQERYTYIHSKVCVVYANDNDNNNREVVDALHNCC